MRSLPSALAVMFALGMLAGCGDDDPSVDAGGEPGATTPDGDAAGGSDPVTDAGALPGRPAEFTGTVTTITVTEPVTENCVDPATLDPEGSEVSVSSDDPPLCTDPATAPVGGILVEELPGQDGGQKISLAVPSGIPFQRSLPHGTTVPAAFADLAEGATVEAWVDGPVAESFPLQGAASALLITG